MKKILTVTIKDCRVDTFRSGGKGGQHQNKTNSGVRIVHTPSGAIGESRESRHQIQNKRTAFRRMAESNAFQTWNRIMVARLMGQETIEDIVDRLTQPQYLLIETQGPKGWETC